MNTDVIQQIENLLQIGRFSDAKQQAGQYAAEYPEDSYAHALLCRAFLGLDEIASADRAVQNALSMDPDEAYFAFLMSKVCHQKKHFEPARYYAEQANKLEPENEHYLMQLMYMHLQNGELKHAKAVVDQVLKLFPNSFEAHQAKGELCQQLEQYGQATEHFDIALKHEPEDDYLLYSLAYCQLESKHYHNAVLNMLNLVKRLPSDQDYSRELYRMISRYKSKSPLKGKEFWQNLPPECEVFYSHHLDANGFFNRWASWITGLAWLGGLAVLVWLFSLAPNG